MNLDQLEELVGRMTPGEWEFTAGNPTIITSPGTPEYPGRPVVANVGGSGSPRNPANAAGIAALRNAAPALIRAARQNERLRVALELIRHDADFPPETGSMELGERLIEIERIARAALAEQEPAR